MRKYVVLLLLLIATLTWAQDKVMQVHSKDGAVYEIPTAQVDSITFITSLIGTKWKAAGIVNAETGEIKILDPPESVDWITYYTLTFRIEGDGWLSGEGVGNLLGGRFEIDYTTNSIHILMWQATSARPYLDEDLYVETLNSVHSFSLQGDKLLLYFGEQNNYLLFNLLKP